MSLSVQQTQTGTVHVFVDALTEPLCGASWDEAETTIGRVTCGRCEKIISRIRLKADPLTMDLQSRVEVLASALRDIEQIASDYLDVDTEALHRIMHICQLSAVRTAMQGE